MAKGRQRRRREKRLERTVETPWGRVLRHV